MKKIFCLALFAIGISSYSQTVLTLQPGPVEGKDADLRELTPDNNVGDTDEFLSFDWTFSGTEGLGCSVIQFDLSALPENIEILDAKLSLYYNSTSSSSGQAGENACNLKKITSDWDEQTVTWNTMPSTTDVNQVLLETSTSDNQDYLDIDILNFVNEWYANSTTNYGMMLKIIDESLYNSMKFCSSDYSDSELRPKLVINYKDNTAVNSISNQNLGFSISPNPSNGIFYINFSEQKVKNNIGIQIYNSIGKTIHQEENINFSSNSRKKYDFSYLDAGIYFLNLIDGKSLQTIKFVIE